jgi:hypothetical protein
LIASRGIELLFQNDVASDEARTLSGIAAETNQIPVTGY